MNDATPNILGAFFTLATLILICVGVALAWPGTFFDSIWHVFESRRAGLMPYRAWLGPGFLSLAVVMTAAAIGCYARRMWGLNLAIVIFALNGCGDAVNFLRGDVTAGLIGIVAAIVIVYWLTRQDVRAVFRHEAL